MRKRQNEADACCPTCGRKFAAPRRTAAPTKATSEMTDAELYAHYKATAPLEDVRFFLRAHLSPAVRAGAQALELSILNLKIPRADIYRQLRALQDRWSLENYWHTVIMPADRLERRRLKARARMGLPTTEPLERTA